MKHRKSKTRKASLSSGALEGGGRHALTEVSVCPTGSVCPRGPFQLGAAGGQQTGDR